MDIQVSTVEEGTGERTRSWTDFEHIRTFAMLRDGFGDASRRIKVSKEMLAEVFFGANVHG
jgi:hypothetical protein